MKSKLMASVAFIGLACAAGLARAADLPSTKAPADSWMDFGPLAWNGFTLYGALEGGGTWQSHGAPYSPLFGPGEEYLLAKNSNHSGFGYAPNAINWNNIGVKFNHEIAPGLAVIADVDTQFSGSFGPANHLGSMAANDGVPLTKQGSNANSARAGQVITNIGYAGLASPTFGALTFGRQLGLTMENIVAYDPMRGANAFSIIGFSGTAGGAGATEDSRLDNTLKYRLNYGPLHFAALYQIAGFGEGDYSANNYQLGLGGVVQNLALDAAFSHMAGAITSSPLAAITPATPAGTLQGVATDNTTVQLTAKYTWSQFKVFGGYEHVIMANAHNPVPNGFEDIGGYIISSMNSAPYAHDRILQYFWTGTTYAYNSKLDLTAAYYHELQNSYGAKGCDTIAASSCSGTQDALSALADYHFTKHFEVYAGLMYSVNTHGMASGYLFKNTIDPTAGARFTF